MCIVSAHVAGAHRRSSVVWGWRGDAVPHGSVQVRRVRSGARGVCAAGEERGTSNRSGCK